MSGERAKVGDSGQMDIDADSSLVNITAGTSLELKDSKTMTP